MPRKGSDNSPKDKDKDSGSKSMNINWMNMVALLVVVGAIIAILLIYLLGPSFVKDDTEGITIKNKTMFDENVTVAKNLVCSATSELGTERVPLAKLYVKDIVNAPKILKKSITEDADVDDWEDQDILELKVLAGKVVTVTLPTSPVTGRRYTVGAKCTTEAKFRFKTTNKLRIPGPDILEIIDGEGTSFSFSFVYVGSEWFRLA